MAITKRLALITGGTSGIGLAVARQLASEGRSIALFDINRQQLDEIENELSKITDVFAKVVDVSDFQQVSQAVQELYSVHGSIDILVNNVGGSTRRTEVEDMPIEVFNEIVDLNLKTAFVCTKAVIPRMKKCGWGRIVNVSSVAGRSHAYSTNSDVAYISAKAGILGFSKQCAAEFAPFGITVNTVAPGLTETERALATWASRPSESREEMLKLVPVGRWGMPEEMAGAVCYFCSETAGYTTGAIIDVNGGLYM